MEFKKGQSLGEISAIAHRRLKSEADKKEHQGFVQKSQDREERKNEAIGKAFSTPDGLIALKWLMDECGYNVSPVVMSGVTGEILQANTAANALRGALFLQLKRKLPPESLYSVEFADWETFLPDMDDLLN